MIKMMKAAIVAAVLALGNLASATSLCNVGVTTPVTGSIPSPVVSGFGTPMSLSIQGRFTYVASSATSADVYIQSTIDGVNWFDIANFHWTTLSAWTAHNVQGSAALVNASLTDGGLTSNTVQVGLLGAQYRCKVTIVGTYGAGTNIAVDVFARH